MTASVDRVASLICIAGPAAVGKMLSEPVGMANAALDWGTDLTGWHVSVSGGMVLFTQAGDDGAPDPSKPVVLVCNALIERAPEFRAQMADASKDSILIMRAETDDDPVAATAAARWRRA